MHGIEVVSDADGSVFISKHVDVANGYRINDINSCVGHKTNCTMSTWQHVRSGSICLCEHIIGTQSNRFVVILVLFMVVCFVRYIALLMNCLHKEQPSIVLLDVGGMHIRRYHLR